MVITFEHLKAKLTAPNTPSRHYVGVLSEVIAPEVATHLIASNLAIQYDEAQNVLRDEAAWEQFARFYKKGGFIYAARRIVALN